MKTQLQFRIGLVKPVKRFVGSRMIKATDKAWREAMFGMGGSRKRIGGIRLGAVCGQPIAMIAELQTEVADGTPVWTIKGADCVYGIAGPAAIYNDAGFGPASLGISIDDLKELIEFDPEPEELAKALQRTLDLKKEAI